jgi:tetratricopeptide (TPR) repeat protein
VSFDKCKDLAASAGDHRRLAAALINLGSLELQLGRAETGVGMIEQAISLREHACGRAAPETIDALLDLARSLMVTGKTEQAAAVADDAVLRIEETSANAEQLAHLKLVGLSVQIELAARLKRVMEKSSVDELLQVGNGSESVLQLAATYYASQNMFRETIDVLKRMEETDELLAQIGMLHMSAGDNELAEEVLVRALRSAESTHGMQSMGLAKPLWLLALAQQVCKRPQDAQKQLLRLLALIKNRGDEKNNEFQARVTRQLAILSAEQGMPNQHLHYLKTALRLAEPFQELKASLEQDIALAQKKT